MSYNAATFLAGLYSPNPSAGIALAPQVTTTILAAEPAPQVKPARIDAGKLPDHRPMNLGSGPTRRLCGNGFPSIPATIPPASILATPTKLCPACGARPVLAELRTMTGGRCYGCWSGSAQANSPAARSSPQSGANDSQVDDAADAVERE